MTSKKWQHEKYVTEFSTQSTKSSTGSTMWNVGTQPHRPLGRLTARHAVGGLE
jgi:hypothetical protein